MRPGILKQLDKFGLLGTIVSEAPQIKSSSAIAVWMVQPNEDLFHSGRRLMRAWLEMTGLDVYGCPLSSVTDNPTTCRILKSRLGIEEATELVMALRIGPATDPYLSPRI